MGVKTIVMETVANLKNQWSKVEYTTSGAKNDGITDVKRQPRNMLTRNSMEKSMNVTAAKTYTNRSRRKKSYGRW